MDILIPSAVSLVIWLYFFPVLRPVLGWTLVATVTVVLQFVVFGFYTFELWFLIIVLGWVLAPAWAQLRPAR